MYFSWLGNNIDKEIHLRGSVLSVKCVRGELGEGRGEGKLLRLKEGLRLLFRWGEGIDKTGVGDVKPFPGEPGEGGRGRLE